MTFKKHLLFIYFVLFFLNSGFSQNESWFYVRAKKESFTPKFKQAGNKLVYIGNDKKLKNIFSKYTVFEFKKTFKKAKKKNLKKTFFVVSNNPSLLNDLLKNARHLFDFGELINEEDKKIFEPDDYGLTSTLGANKGLQVNLDYLDYLGLPKAWYYTTGNSSTIIGMSDGTLDPTSPDLKNKTKILKKSSISKGHGSAVASIAAAQGNNGYGVPGVCYDCDIYATTYGDFRNFAQLLELSRAGVKVINCSWVGRTYYQTAQDAVDEMFNNGTVLVAGAGNKNWKETKGELLYYPASYNHVISVSTGMYKHNKLNDGKRISKKGLPYFENIEGFIGRTAGYVNQQRKDKIKIYPVSVTTLNKEVDLLAPSTGVLLYNKYILENKIVYDDNEHTSNSTPFVTGAIGLMFSLNPCLPVDEVESILKINSKNIDNVQVNRPYLGNFGSGMLNVGNSVKMVYDLYTEGKTATIENQSFSRWDFKLTSYSEKVLIQNQKFTHASTLDVTAKNSIVIGKNTVLKPGKYGSVHLKIDPSLQKECDLVLREGFPNNKYYHPEK